MLSNGRVVFGIGGGWNVEEMEHHGATYKTRFKLMRERVLAMKALWTEDEAAFDGELVKFDKSWSWPKPLQKPHPPIILGGETEYTLRRIVEFCDGWMPRATPDFEPAENMARLRQAADEAGRDMSELSVTVFRAPADAQQLESYAQAGISGGLLQLPSADRDTVLRLLDEYAPLLE
jgi:alkanesulfonate monooxygenase SsuD/methylene tetrahydromethanopterin reductase-like flavin-dependent oxidoreductase (luciferase family)